MRVWSSLVERLSLLRAHGREPEELQLLLECTAVGLSAPLLARLQLASLGKLLRGVGAGQRRPMDAGRASQVALAALRLGRPLVRPGCLPRGMTLCFSLRRAGHSAELAFGMGRSGTGDGYDGHCWVVMNGAPYLEARDPQAHYVTMCMLGRSAGNPGRADHASS